MINYVTETLTVGLHPWDAMTSASCLATFHYYWHSTCKTFCVRVQAAEPFTSSS